MSFKKAGVLLAASYLAGTNARVFTFHDGQHQVEGPVPHYVRSTLEDLDLAAGNSPFTGKPESASRSITVTIGPDGKRTITGGTEQDFDRFFETDPHGNVHPRGSSFGRSDPFKEMFGGRDPFGHSGSPFGRSGSSDPFGGHSPFGSRFGRPSQGSTHQPTQPERPVAHEEPKHEEPKHEEPKHEEPKHEEQPQEPTQEEEPSDEEAEEPRSAFRDPLEDFFKRLQQQRGQGGQGSFGGFGEPAKPSEPLKMDNPEGSPFRIVPDFTTLNAGVSAKHAKYVKESLIPAIVDYFSATLKLKYPNKDKITSPNYSNLAESCDGGVPQSYVKEGVEGDLGVFIRLSNAPYEGYVARAVSCVFDSRSGRTTLSSINFNVAHIEVDEGNPLVHAKNIYTTLHELTHVLGFSRALYDNYLLPNGQPNRNAILKENGMTMVNVEPLTTRLRKHYGCDKINGAPLENEGGSGSMGAHFERRIFFNEFMTASEVHDGKISEFTLALLEGTGWYVVDYSKAEPFAPGKGQGCNFFFGECQNKQGLPNFDEFCPSEGERLCSGSRNGVAICSSQDQFGDGCKMPQVQYEYDCRNPEARRIAEVLPELQVFGAEANSKCFMGDLVHSGYRANQESTYCLNYKCNGTGATKTLDIIVGKAVGTCTKKGKITVAGFNGGLECPDPVAFCGAVEESFCPRGCMGRGTCNSGKCECKAGFKGVDCAYRA